MSPWRRLLKAMDMLDGQDKPVFSKLVIVYIAGVATFQGWFGTVIAIALLSAAFGRSIFSKFLYRSNFTSSESLKVNRLEEVIRSRRSIEGHEESP